MADVFEGVNGKLGFGCMRLPIITFEKKDRKTGRDVVK